MIDSIDTITDAVIILFHLSLTFITNHPAPALTGTCASIGYSTACCPPDRNCQASDGNCQCGAYCHIHGDCCSDVYCPSRNYNNIVPVSP